MTIHHIAGHAIRTDNIYPPISVRNFDWQAVYDNDDDEGQMSAGHGCTEQEAIDDLVDNHPREPKAAMPAPVVALLRLAFSAALPPKIPLTGAEPSDFSEAIDRVTVAAGAFLAFVHEVVEPLSHYKDDEMASKLGDLVGVTLDQVGDLTGTIRQYFDRAQEARPQRRTRVW